MNENTNLAISSSLTVPHEAIISGTSHNVIEDLVSLVAKKSSNSNDDPHKNSAEKFSNNDSLELSLSTNRDSHYISTLVKSSLSSSSVNSTNSIHKLYWRFDLKRLKREETIKDDEILLCVTCLKHREILKSGKLALKRSRITRFWNEVVDSFRTSAYNSVIPALNIPGCSNYTRYFHLQFDIDEDKFALDVSEKSGTVLDNLQDRKDFSKTWTSFIERTIRENGYKNVSYAPKLTYYRRENNEYRNKGCGLHIFVRNVRMFFFQIKAIAQKASRDKEILRVLDRHGLRLDISENIFIPYTDKDGNKYTSYKYVNFEKDANDIESNEPEPFPVCICTNCLPLPSSFGIDVKRYGIKEVAKYRKIAEEHEKYLKLLNTTTATVKEKTTNVNQVYDNNEKRLNRSSSISSLHSVSNHSVASSRYSRWSKRSVETRASHISPSRMIIDDENRHTTIFSYTKPSTSSQKYIYKNRCQQETRKNRSSDSLTKNSLNSSPDTHKNTAHDTINYRSKPNTDEIHSNIAEQYVDDQINQQSNEKERLKSRQSENYYIDARNNRDKEETTTRNHSLESAEYRSSLSRFHEDKASNSRLNTNSITNCDINRNIANRQLSPSLVTHHTDEYGSFHCQEKQYTSEAKQISLSSNNSEEKQSESRKKNYSALNLEEQSALSNHKDNEATIDRQTIHCNVQESQTIITKVPCEENRKYRNCKSNRKRPRNSSRNNDLNSASASQAKRKATINELKNKTSKSVSNSPVNTKINDGYKTHSVRSIASSMSANVKKLTKSALFGRKKMSKAISRSRREKTSRNSTHIAQEKYDVDREVSPSLAAVESVSSIQSPISNDILHEVNVNENGNDCNNSDFASVSNYTISQNQFDDNDQCKDNERNTNQVERINACVSEAGSDSNTIGVSYENFLPGHLMSAVFAKNALCLAVYNTVFPLMFEQFASAIENIGSRSSCFRRYNHHHLSTVLVTYAAVVWDRYTMTRLLASDEKDFCIGLLRSLVDHCARRAEANLNVLWREILCTVSPTLATVRNFITDKSPTIPEILFSMLHLGLWSSSSPSEKGVPFNNGEYVASCPLVVGLIKEYLRNKDEFLNTQSTGTYSSVDQCCETLFTDDIAPCKQSPQAKAMQRIVKYCPVNTLELDKLVSLLFALAYPYDGTLMWSTSLNPAWVSISEDDFKSRVLELPRQEVAQTVATCVNHDIAPTKTRDGREKFTPYKLTLSPMFCLKCMSGIWRSLHQKIQFPPEMLMTADNKVFAISTGRELYNIPCLRTAPVFATGTTSETFRIIERHAESIVRAFAYFVSEHIKKLPNGTYLSYPDGQVKCDTNGDISHTLLLRKHIPFRQRIDDVRNFLKLESKFCETWLPKLCRGSISLFELFGTTENLEKVIRFHREVKYRGRRKKVALCYSYAPNHGKSTCAKIFQGLYRESCHALSFAAMSAESDASMTNSALVGAAGKMLTFIDEIPAGGRSRGAQLSMHKIKTLTGGTSSTGYRELYSNSATQYYNCAVVTFSNNLPHLSETGDADVQRLYPIQFPRQFPVTEDDTGLRQKIITTYTALDTIMLALEFCGKRALRRDGFHASVAMNAFFDAMDCRNFDGSKFTLADDARDMDPRTCPDYEECMANYNEETRIVLSFVSRKITQFKLHEWSVIKDWFETTVRTETNHKTSKMNSMLKKLREHYDRHKGDEALENNE